MRGACSMHTPVGSCLLVVLKLVASIQPCFIKNALHKNDVKKEPNPPRGCLSDWRHHEWRHSTSQEDTVPWSTLRLCSPRNHRSEGMSQWDVGFYVTCETAQRSGALKQVASSLVQSIFVLPPLAVDLDDMVLLGPGCLLSCRDSGNSENNTHLLSPEEIHFALTELMIVQNRKQPW